VLNGRFKGGYITDAYGRPADRVFAVQLELAQRTYMDESRPSQYDPAHARVVQPCIQQLLKIYLDSARNALS
jgi:formiminoglutamase